LSKHNSKITSIFPSNNPSYQHVLTLKDTIFHPIGGG